MATPRQKLVKSAVVMANELKAEAILVFTRHGHMARHTGWQRPRYSPICALCPNEEVARGLSLSWGVTPFVVPFDLINPENTIESALKSLSQQGRLHTGNTIVIIGSILVGEQIVDAVQMRVV
jgi:pyruvate kinase